MRPIANEGPVVALLPLQPAEEGEGPLAQALLEEICLELSRFSALQVIAWTSGLAVAGLPDQEAAAQLGATHVLRGRLRRQGDRLRLSAVLSDAARGTQLWSEQLEAAAEAVFEMQDEVVARVAATLAARLDETSLQALRRKPLESLAAYELTLQGLALLRQGTPEADAAARGLFERALALDPHHARAQAGLSLSWFNEWSCQFWDRFEENGRLAYEHAHRALDLDDRDALPHLVVGQVLLYHREFERASWYLDRALVLCPNDAGLLIHLALCEAFLGRPEAGIGHAQKAMRLNPYHPNYYYAYATFPYLTARRFAETVELGRQVVGMPLIDIPAHMAIALLHLGQEEEALRQLAVYDEVYRKRITFGRPPEPGESARWSVKVNPYRRAEDSALLLEGFRRLGALATETAGGERGGSAAALPPREGNALLRQGDGWLVAFARQEAVLPDLKGLHDIVRLLERPGEEIHCLDLAEREDGAFGGDAVLDDKGRQAVKQRIRDLQEALAEAEDHHDLGRAERLRAELDGLVEGLARALGLGGRSRRLGSLTERARTTVTWRIRHALRKIEAAHAPLGRHLANSLRTGTFCAYRPERPLHWRVSA